MIAIRGPYNICILKNTGSRFRYWLSEGRGGFSVDGGIILDKITVTLEVRRSIALSSITSKRGQPLAKITDILLH